MAQKGGAVYFFFFFFFFSSSSSGDARLFFWGVSHFFVCQTSLPVRAVPHRLRMPTVPASRNNKTTIPCLTQNAKTTTSL